MTPLYLDKYNMHPLLQGLLPLILGMPLGRDTKMAPTDCVVEKTHPFKKNPAYILVKDQLKQLRKIRFALSVLWITDHSPF